MKIGNHTWNHLDLTMLSTSSVTVQLNRTESALGYRPRCVRPPYGATNSWIQSIIAARGQRRVRHRPDGLLTRRSAAAAREVTVGVPE